MAIKITVSMRTKLKSYGNLLNEICFKNITELGVDKTIAYFKQNLIASKFHFFTLLQENIHCWKSNVVLLRVQKSSGGCLTDDVH